MLTASAAALIAAGVVGFQIESSHGYPERLPDDARRLLAFKETDYKTPLRLGECFLRPEQGWADLDATSCLNSPGKTVLLWGDSFAAHYYAALRPVVERFGYSLSQTNASLCAPIIDYTIRVRPNCRSFNDGVMAWIERKTPSIIVMSASWPTDARSLNLLDSTVDRLAAIGARVVLIGQSPRYPEPVPNILARRVLRGEPSTDFDRRDIKKMTDAEELMRHRYEAKGVVYLSPLELFCGPDACPLADPSGTPLHVDFGHLSAAGATLAVERMFPPATAERIFGEVSASGPTIR